MSHLLTLWDLTPQQTREILDLAIELKSGVQQGKRPSLLENQVLVQIYEKPSLRTRVSFEAAIGQLGGTGMFMTEKEAGLHGRETMEDIARVAGRMADFIVLRTFSQKTIEVFAQYAQGHVVNGLSDDFHPCQALTDVLTIEELFGSCEGRKVVYLGDSNNVTRSLAIACAQLKMPFVACSPEDYQLDREFIDQLKSTYPGCEVTQSSEPQTAVADADVLYTDVWASMGQEEEAESRKKIFADYQINEELLACAPKHAKLLHCLPAKRDQEVTDAVVEGPQSAMFDQAENRLHIAKAVFVWLSRQ